jgi:hypothetical protein
MLLSLSCIRFFRDQPRRWVAFGLLWAAERLVRTGLRLYQRRFISLLVFRYILSTARALERAAIKVGFGIKHRTIGRIPPKRILK